MIPHSGDVVTKRWAELDTDELYEILKLRTDVFYVEQHVDESELDGRDREPGTLHVWLRHQDRIAAYLRVLTADSPEYRDARLVVGRVVVPSDLRGGGLASALLEWVVDRFGDSALLLHSQSYIAALYARFGFEPFGDEYLEAGIPHVSMYRAPRES